MYRRLCRTAGQFAGRFRAPSRRFVHSSLLEARASWLSHDTCSKSFLLLLCSFCFQLHHILFPIDCDDSARGESTFHAFNDVTQSGECDTQLFCRSKTTADYSSAWTHPEQWRVRFAYRSRTGIRHLPSIFRSRLLSTCSTRCGRRGRFSRG